MDSLDEAVNELSAALEAEDAPQKAPVAMPSNELDAAVFRAFGIEGTEANETIQEAPKDEVEVSAEDADEEEESPKPLKGAQKRIKQLIDRSKKAETELKDLKTSLSQELAQKENQLKNQFQQQLQQMQYQNQLLQQQMQQQMGQIQETNQAKNLTGLEKWEYENGKKTESTVNQRVQDALRPIQGELNKLRQEQTQREEMARKQATYAHYTGKAGEVYNNILAKDFAAEDVAALAEPFKELVLTSSAAFQKEPEEVAETLKKILDKYYSARLKSHQLKTKAQAVKNQAMPKIVTSQRSSAGADDLPDFSATAIRKAGYKNYMDAFMNKFVGVKA